MSRRGLKQSDIASFFNTKAPDKPKPAKSPSKQRDQPSSTQTKPETKRSAKSPSPPEPRLKRSSRSPNKRDQPSTVSKHEPNKATRRPLTFDSDEEDEVVEIPRKVFIASSPDKKQDVKTKKEAAAKPKAEKSSKPELAQIPDEKKQAKAASYVKSKTHGGLKHQGTKTVPVGAPNSLENLTFVTTGVLESFERADIDSIVEKYGGKVASTVSSKTSYLIVGDEPGVSKIAKAKSLKTPILNEDEFLELIQRSTPKQSAQRESRSVGKRSEPESDKEVEEVPKTKQKDTKSKGSASKSTHSPSTSSRAKSHDQSEAERKKGTTTPKSKAKAGKSDETPGPSETPDEKKRARTAAYFKFMSRGGPKNLGAKTVPGGAPKCFDKLTFVTTGVLDSFEREDIVTIVEKYGGRVTSAVSGKTSYLLVGDEPGQSKVAQAKSKKIPMITEDEFLEMIRKSNPNQPTQSTAQPEFFGEGDEDESEELAAVVDVPVSKPKGKATPPIMTTPKRSSKRLRIESDSDEAEVELPPSKAPKSENKRNRSPAKVKPMPDPVPAPAVPSTSTQSVRSTSASSSVSSTTTQPVVSHDMWVDKFKPKVLKSIVGQAGDKSNAQKLLKWLTKWFDLHGRGGEKVRPSQQGYGFGRDPEGKSFKAVLLSGPPGIGKTTTAHLCCKELGYDYFELNASDTRNKRGLHDMLADALTSEALTGFKEKSRRHILIMDEVDGMSGNEDRGGIQELIGLIKSSRVPIICICNDRMHPKIRSLSNYCFDLRFNKPTNEQLKAMIQSLCFKEKMKLHVESVQQLINSTDHDIRQILHQLQLIKESSTTDSLYNPHKDLRFGPWDVCRKVFSEHEHRSMSLHDKQSLFFQDYNIGPLFVQENYVRWVPTKAMGDKYVHMDKIKTAAESIATGDLVDSIIRRSQNWSLLPTQSIFGSIIPGEVMEGNETSGINFPAWLGQNSRKGKISRLLQHLYGHVHLQVSGSLEALNLDYLPYLHRFIVQPLIQDETLGSVEVMHEYSLLREDLESISEIVLWDGVPNPMESVSTKTKSAFTKGVNKEQMVPYSVVKVSKRKAGGGGGGQEGEIEGDYANGEEAGDEVEEEEEDVLEKDAMIKVRSGSKKSGRSNSSGPSSSKGSSREVSKKSKSKSSKSGSTSGSRSGCKKK